jgi:ribosomal protein S18
MNISEFERTKPRETHEAFMNVKEKYETLLKETVIMDEVDAARVEITSQFLKDLKKIYKKFLTGL